MPIPLNNLLVFGLIIFTIAFSTFSFAEDEKKFQLLVYLTKKEAFEIAFPGADAIKKEKRWLTENETQAIEKLCLQTIKEMRFTFYYGIKNDKPMGYMLIDNIIGKSFPITFMTVLNADGTVRDVEIMVYLLFSLFILSFLWGSFFRLFFLLSCSRY